MKENTLNIDCIVIFFCDIAGQYVKNNVNKKNYVVIISFFFEVKMYGEKLLLHPVGFFQDLFSITSKNILLI